jgi:serine protease
MRRTLVVATLAAAALPALSADVTVMRAAREPVDGLILKVKPAAAEGALQTATQAGRRLERLAGLARAAGYPGSVAWRHLSDRMVSVKLPSSLTPEQQKALMAKIMATGQVEWVEANDRVWPHAVGEPTNTEFTSQQWWASASPSVAGNAGVPNIREAWSRSTGALSNAAPIAILDTGRVAHQDIRASGANVLSGYDFVSDAAYSGDGGGRDSDPSDPGDFVDATGLNCGLQSSSWHGLAIEGIVSARVSDNAGMAGIHWNPRVMSLRVAGKCGAAKDDIIAAMYWASGVAVPSAFGTASPLASPVQAKVVNISFGGLEGCDMSYQTAVDDLRGRGTVVVASAGNEHGAVSRPANCQNVVAVAALNRLGLKSTYSNFGNQVTVSTVGGDPAGTNSYTDAGAWGAVLGDSGLYTVGNSGTRSPSTVQSDYFLYAGTSFSAPIVTGVIALMFDVNPSLTVDQVIAGLKASARPHVTTSLVGACSTSNPGRCRCTTSTCGAGILDADEALRWAANPSGYVNLNTIPVNLDSNSTVRLKLEQALTIAAQDRNANITPASTTQPSSGGGGGAFGGAWVAVLGLMVAWRHGLRAVRWRHVLA